MVLTSRGITEDLLACKHRMRPAFELEHLAMARVLMAEDRPEAALPWLEALAARQKRDGRLRRYAQVRAVTAITACRSGNGQAALAALSEAVTLSMKGGAVRTLIEEAGPLQDVLTFAQSRLPLWRDASGGTGAFVAGLMTQDRAAAAPQNPAGGMAELSPREADIARLLLNGLANRDIGTTHAIAPDTVKWHLKNIFGKLGADNRTRAVLRLQKIGMPIPTRKGG